MKGEQTKVRGKETRIHRKKKWKGRERIGEVKGSKREAPPIDTL